MFKCACGRPFSPKTFPHTRNCQACGVTITVIKPEKKK